MPEQRFTNGKANNKNQTNQLKNSGENPSSNVKAEKNTIGNIAFTSILNSAFANNDSPVEKESHSQVGDRETTNNSKQTKKASKLSDTTKKPNPKEDHEKKDNLANLIGGALLLMVTSRGGDQLDNDKQIQRTKPFNDPFKMPKPKGVLADLSPDSYEIFYLFVKREWPSENLECYQQIQGYKRNPKHSIAISIFEKYLDPQAKTAIHVPQSSFSMIKAAIGQYKELKQIQTKEERMKRNIASTFQTFTGFSKTGDPTLFSSIEEILMGNLAELYFKFQSTPEARRILKK